MANKRKRSRVGREAVEMLKDFYESGGGYFENIYDITAWLKEQRIKCTYIQAGAWDRQARLERADKLQSTTYPSRRNGFSRQGSPTHGERVQSREARLKDTSTRVSNDLREARADAAQPDASAIERARVALIKSAHDLMKTVGGLS